MIVIQQDMLLYFGF